MAISTAPTDRGSQIPKEREESLEEYRRQTACIFAKEGVHGQRMNYAVQITMSATVT